MWWIGPNSNGNLLLLFHDIGSQEVKAECWISYSCESCIHIWKNIMMVFFFFPKQMQKFLCKDNNKKRVKTEYATFCKS